MKSNEGEIIDRYIYSFMSSNLNSGCYQIIPINSSSDLNFDSRHDKNIHTDEGIDKKKKNKLSLLLYN